MKNEKASALKQSKNTITPLNEGYAQSSFISGNAGSSHNQQDYIDLRELWMVIRRRYQVVVGAVLSSLCIAVIFLAVATPLYKAESVIQANVQKTTVVDIQAVLSGNTADETQIQSQLDIINSRNLAGIVVDTNNLVNDPEFSPDVNHGGIIKWLKSLINNGESLQDSEEAQRIRSETINEVLRRLNVSRNPKSYTIIISFTSRSPEKAARLANSFVEQYLQGQLAVKFDATKRANSWLTAKLSELQVKVRESESLVQAFREKHGLIETGGQTITDQQLAELNTQLILARTERAQAEARMAGSGGDESSTDVLDSKLIQDLRGQEVQVLRKKSDLSSQYGPKHPKMINVTSELRDLRDKISLEIQKVKSSLSKEVTIAKAREESLQNSLNELQDKSGLSMKARIELDELERQKNANKSLYESFLERSKETSEGQGLERPDALVISTAEVPLDISYPRKIIVMLLALMAGIFIGLICVFVMEYLDNAVNNSKQAEDLTGINTIGVIPELTKAPNIVDYLTKRPSSVFAESLRSVLTAVHFSNPDNSPKVIMVTSSVPKEGKSSFALSFATLVAKSGKKVLLIDADLKRPTVAKALKKEFKFGLSDLLAGDATESQTICHDKNSGLDYIPAHPNTVNSHNLLASNRMKELLEKMKKTYDIVVIDTPPVMVLSDCIVLAKVVDTTMFVLRWQKTSREIVRAAIEQLKSYNVNIAGVVLTRVDIEKQSQYGGGDKGHYYKNYSEYYSS